MKTQISRRLARSFPRYSGVYQQQGRLLSDADWNALSDIDRQRVAAVMAAAVASGAPREGGLRLDGDTPAIQPGVIFVEGHYGVHADTPTGDAPASLVAPDAQSDYPHPPAWTPANRLLYVDLWERPVTALEERQAAEEAWQADMLLDPALHGADTCTRTRTMVQVKWCATGIDPLDPNLNPPRGDAGLHLRLREVYQSGDPCDPCAEEVPVDENIGNYLFRLEVHDVYREDGAMRVVLKWSRENGAEAHPVDDVPPGFDSGDWIWEFFDADSEKLAGQHFPLEERRRRGVLQDGFRPPGEEAPRALVRRWDGYAILEPEAGRLVQGQDRGVRLSGDLGAEQHGHSRFEDGVWQVNLELLVCRLQVAGVRFLAGDYWLAPVREAVHGPGDDVLGSETAPQPPEGILHHYLVLGRTDAEGRPQPLTDAERRRLRFPPLTDLRAADVAFRDGCERLFAGAPNVQAALDRLCTLSATDVQYRPPDCPGGIAGRLPAPDRPWPRPDDDGRITLQSVLDTLLCDLDARHLPLHRSEALCDELANDANVASVQDAIERLCALQRNLCAIPVEPGRLEGILQGFAADASQQTLRLCLLPGEHSLSGLALDDKRLLVITGAGRLQSTLVLEAPVNRLQAEQIRLENVGVRIVPAEGRLRLEGSHLEVRDCGFMRSGRQRVQAAMLEIAPQGLDAVCRLHDNRLSSTWQRYVFDGLITDLFPDNLVPDTVIDKLADLQRRPEILGDALEYNAMLKSIAKTISGLPAEDRRVLANNLRAEIEKRTVVDAEAGNAPNRARILALEASAGAAFTALPVTATGAGVSIPAAPGGETPALSGAGRLPEVSAWANVARFANRVRIDHDFLAGLASERIDAGFLGRATKGLDGILGYLFESGVSPALQLVGTGFEAALVHNRIDGDVILDNRVEAPVDPVDLAAEAVCAVPLISEGRLTLEDCRLSRLVGHLEAGLTEGNTTGKGAFCFQTVQILNNTFTGSRSSVIASQIDCRGNHFNAPPENAEDETVAWLRAAQGMVAANMAAAGEQVRIRLITDARIVENNLLRIEHQPCSR